MTTSPCDAARRALAAGLPGGAAAEHVAACAACSAFADRLVRADAALADHAVRASREELPAALRTRILCAADAARANPVRARPAGRILDLALRLAAVAAVLVAAFAFGPDALAAAELPVPGLGLADLGIDAALADPRRALAALDEAPPLDLPGAGFAAAAGAALVAAAAWSVLGRRGAAR